jgi:hypothetical protein
MRRDYDVENECYDKDMKSIEVHIREKEKRTNLSLFNLRDEVVNVLYKDTIANSTRADLQFFVLIYFASLKIGEKTFLESIFDEGLPKFDKLNDAFSQRHGYLRAGEYRAMVNEYGLSEFFENDTFFILIDAILNIDRIDSRFSSIYTNDAEFTSLIDRIRSKYSTQLSSSLAKFANSKIQDDRYDENGNYHDLSKSVYRTVQMRNSRNLTLNLQKYTTVRDLKSRSPVDLVFLQQIHPQMIFDLWDKYHVAEYMKSAWQTANNDPIITAGVLGGLHKLAVKYKKWKNTDGVKERQQKDSAKADFENAKDENNKLLNQLNLKLVDSVLKSNERLESELADARKELSELRPVLSKDDEKIKKLEERVSQLENLSIDTKVVDDKNGAD